jgi:hypothetical protein
MASLMQTEQGGLAHGTWCSGKLSLVQGALPLGVAVEAPGVCLSPLEMPHYQS